MKFMETKFEEYIQSTEKRDLHPELLPLFDTKDEAVCEPRNLIFYGPPGVGKYTQALRYINHFSPSGLKYERKINVVLCKKKQYQFKISDIHFEVDMELLGCNAKSLWNTVYHHVLDILSTRQTHRGIILCRNFHRIHSELLDTFYSYMQTLAHKELDLSYILLTEGVAFIPDNILTRCFLVPIKRPSKKHYIGCFGRQLLTNVNISKIVNIKDLYNVDMTLSDIGGLVNDKIIGQIENYETMDFLHLRDSLYDIFIYHMDLNESIWVIFGYFIRKGGITSENIEGILLFLYRFLKYFNNNYRPIYHLERFALFLCKEVHGL